MEKSKLFSTLGTEQVHPDSMALDTMSPLEIAALMNRMDRGAAEAVERALPALAEAIEQVARRMAQGGRLFYVGAGTSGRLGVLDASECPPTFGVAPDLVVGIIAGGDAALRSPIEGAEDDAARGARDLAEHGLCGRDAVVAISASGYAPYCVGALEYANALGALSVAMSCNEGANTSAVAAIAIEAPTGAEVLSGSTRLRAGTATKMMLNILSTAVMVRLGKAYKNLMVDVRSSNDKLRDRSIRIVMNATGRARPEAEALYRQAGEDIKAAIVMGEAGASREAAARALAEADGFVRRAIEALTPSREGTAD